MKETFPIDIIAIAVWCLIAGIALLAMFRSAKHRMYVNADGDLELDEHEDVFSEERMQ